MQAFGYHDTTYPIRDDLVRANRAAWEHVAGPGHWWTGAERVSIADETRAAAGCALCRERKSALSPNAVQGAHDAAGDLPGVVVDTVHRIVTDQQRLTRDAVGRLVEAGFTDGHYVELVGVVTTVVSIDAFHRALGIPPEPLPAPRDGEPSRRRPAGLSDDEAWVPLLDPRRAEGEDRRLYPMPSAPYVLRALSLVPDEVRNLMRLGAAYYLVDTDIIDPTANAGRAITRPQMELVAGRVSALNECFYRTSSHSMLLRASSHMTGDEDDLQAVGGSERASTSSIPRAVELTRFAEAFHGGEPAELATARQQLQDALGLPGLVDAAAIVGNFQRMTRIADSTGIPLDGVVNTMSADIQERLGLRGFGSAKNSEPVGAVWKQVAALSRPVTFRLMRALGAVGRRLRGT